MWLARFRHFLWSAVVGLATLLYVVEEWLWETLQRAMVAMGRAPPVRWLERWIARLPPAGAAFFFVLPTSLALPVKLLALHDIAHGHIIRGGLIIFGAKILATALFAWIYVLTEPALMRVHWFVRLRAAVLRWRDWAYAQIEAHPAWRRMRAAVAQWRARYAAWRQSSGSRRWRAWQRWQRWQRIRRRGAGS
jgi:hypothetical protein